MTDPDFLKALFTANSVLVVDRGGIISWCNDQARELLGVEPRMRPGADFASAAGLFVRTGGNVLSPLRMEDFPLERVFAGGSIEGVEVCVRNARTGNEPLWFSVTVNAVFSTDGEAVDAAIVICRLLKPPAGLEDAHAALEALIQASPLPILSFGVDGNITFWNRAAEQVFGWTGAEVMGRPLPFIPASKEEEHRAFRARDLAGEPLVGREIRRFRKDGTPLDLIVSTAPIRDYRGAIGGVISVYLDITERKRVNEALSKSEEMYRFLSEGLPLMVWTLDAEGRVTYCNRHWIEYSALSTAETASRDWLATIHPEDLPQVRERGRYSRHSGESFEMELRLRRASDGAYRWHICRARLLEHPSGARKWLCTAFDIDNLKQTERALRASEERFRRLMDSDIIGIGFWDQERYVTEANAAFLRATGRSPEDIAAGREIRLDDIPAPESRAPMERLFAQIRERGVSGTGEYEFVRPDGSRVPVLAGAASLDEGGGLAFTLDISDRKKLEEKLRQTAKLDSLGILAGGVAHEFNNLLTTILGNASLALEDAAPESHQADALRSLIQAGERAAALTGQMLAYSGKGRLRVECVDVSAMVHEMEDLLRASAAESVRLELDLAPGLPSAEADPGQLQQVMINLVMNAGEAIRGAGEVRVRTGIEELGGSLSPDEIVGGDAGASGPHVFLEVRDNGHGMNVSTLQSIFDPFFTTKFMGRGLGLATVLGIIRGHNGTIRVRSGPDQGSVFTVYLPASAKAATWPAPEG